VDRASMAVSLEVRAPLLDHRLMELAARIPSRLKLRQGNGKYIFKRAIQDMVPSSVVTRRKQGFAVPVAEWFRGELREMAHAVLFEEDGILNHQCLRRIWDQHQQGSRDHSALLWAVFMFRQWQGRFGRGQNWQTFGPSHAVAQPSTVGEGV
jgi:asparagine synthase (glutamine-hydrolysing)